MKNVIVLLLAGLLMLSFGCGGQQPASIGNESVPNGTVAPPANVTPGENVTPPEANESGELIACEDGTPLGNCSATQPEICDRLGNLIDDAETCGCAPGTLQEGRNCLDSCNDGTKIGQCSADKPGYCELDARIVNRSSLCGCPAGYDTYNDSCRNSCSDGTLKYSCSKKNTPYYCDSSYNLTMNPPKCGCNVWEIYEGGSCFDPSSHVYAEGEVVRVSANVSVKVDRTEFTACGGDMFVKIVFTVINNGDTAYVVKNSTLSLKKGNEQSIMEAPKEGCSPGSMFRWGTIGPGETVSGNVWFLVYGGSGDFYAQFEPPYSPYVVKRIRININPQ